MLYLVSFYAHIRFYSLLRVNPLLPRVPNIKIKKKFQISFCKILKNDWYHTKVLSKRFHLNGHTIGFRPQTQKFEIHYMSPELTLGVKG